MTDMITTEDLFDFEDLFVTYPTPPSLEKLNYYSKMGSYYDLNLRKKEFNSLRLSSSEPKPKRGLPLKHQEFVSKFLSPYTLNDRLIAFHGLGTGKTCLAVQFSELARKINKNQTKTLVLVRGPTSVKNFKRELANVCTDGDYIPSNVERKDKETGKKYYIKLTPEQRAIKTGKLIRKNYNIETFIKFSNDLSRMSDEQIEKTYSDTIIIVDEAHNLRFQPKESKVSLYDQVYRLMHKAQRTKILLLSGTPMRDRPQEIIYLLNLLLPEKNKISAKDFESIIEDKDQLHKLFYGMVSYVRQMESSVKKMFEGNVAANMQKLKTVRHKMISPQQEAYIEAWGKDTKSSKKIDQIDDANDDDEEESTQADSLYEKSRQCSLMCFPDGSYGKDGINSKTWIITDSRGYMHFSKNMIDYIDQKGSDTESRLEMLETLSSKYAAVLRELINNPTEKGFVYCSFVKGSGLMLFSAILEHFGFAALNTGIFKRDVEYEKEETEEEKSFQTEEFFNIDVISKNPNRFAVITGESVTSSVADKIINEVYNNSKNVYGEYLRIILGSHVVGEGTSLKAVRQLHVLSPHWNNSVTDQAIGRGLRTFSHDMLLPEERYIKIFRHATILKDKKMLDSAIDMRMYKLSEDKDILIKRVERAMKESAVDCALNRNRNIRTDIDQDDSAACDYEECDYQCAMVSPNVLKERTIDDTYNLFFADNELDEITKKLTDYFSVNQGADLVNILDEFKMHSNILILRALKIMIDDLKPVRSKSGLVCFLRESNNYYYLTRRIDYPSSLVNSGYANLPEITPSLKIVDMISTKSGDLIETQIDKIDTLDFKDDEDEKEIIRIFKKVFTDKEREMFLENFYVAKQLGIRNKITLRKEYLNFYGKYIADLDDILVSFYLRPKLYYIEKEVLEDAKDEFKDIGKLTEELINKLVWKEGNEIVAKRFEEYEAKKREYLNNNKYGYYAIFSEDKEDEETLGKFTFKLSKTRESSFTGKGKVDKRISKSLPGTKCGTGKYFGVAGLITMNLKLVSDMLRNNEPQEKFPNIKHAKTKKYTFEEIFKSQVFTSQPNEVKTEIMKHKDKEWLQDVLANIISINLMSCESISEWFVKNELYMIV